MNRPLCQCTRCLWARTGKAEAEAWLRVLIDQVYAEEADKELLSAPPAEKPAPPASNPFAA